MPIVMTHGFGNVGLSIFLSSLCAAFLVSLFIYLIKHLQTISVFFLHGKTMAYLLMIGLSHL